MEENTFIKAFGISYAGTLPKIRKSAEPLQPIFEAFTNSLEAISLLQNKSDNGQITIKLKLKSTLFSKEQKSYDFEEIIIEDSGIGFTNEEFERLENLNDDRKGFFNKGSGRVQLLHFFDRSEYLSNFRDETSKTGFKERTFTLSKSDAFLKQNAIVFCKSLKEVSAQSQFTSLTLKTPLSEKDKTFYKELNIEELKENPTSKDYNTQLENEVNELVKIIPLQNRTTLTHYVARRKLVIDLFRKILDKELKIQENNPRNINEKLLHNLIFQQSSDNTNESDLWLVNEDFIYFKGTSEGRLNDIAIDGLKILRDNLSKEEQEFRLSLGEDRLVKKPDILLFPKESKCIIIEFKNPDVNVSDHLNQINNYATLIRNFAIPEYQFHTFFGYLIGEKINPFDVRAHDAEFIEAYHFDYMFRPNKTIAGMFIKGDASLYTEVIKYSTLLERAKLRNEIFIEKLTKPVNK